MRWIVETPDWSNEYLIRPLLKEGALVSMRIEAMLTVALEPTMVSCELPAVPSPGPKPSATVAFDVGWPKSTVAEPLIRSSP